MNVTLQDVYCEPAAKFSKIFSHIAFLCQLIIAPIIIYAIMTQSQKMKTYRWYLINGKFWNTMIRFWFSLASPALLSPYPIFIFNSIIDQFVGKDTWFILFEAFLFAGMTMGMNYVMSALYRLCHLLTLHKVTQWMDRVWVMLLY